MKRKIGLVVTPNGDTYMLDLFSDEILSDGLYNFQ